MFFIQWRANPFRLDSIALILGSLMEYSELNFEINICNMHVIPPLGNDIRTIHS